MQEGDKIIKVNGIETTLPSGISYFAKLSAKFDGKADETYINQNYDKLKKLNHAFTKDEIMMQVAFQEQYFHIEIRL